MVRELEEEDSTVNLQRAGVAAKILKLIHKEENSAHVLVNSLNVSASMTLLKSMTSSLPMPPTI